MNLLQREKWKKKCWLKRKKGPEEVVEEEVIEESVKEEAPEETVKEEVVEPEVKEEVTEVKKEEGTSDRGS